MLRLRSALPALIVALAVLARLIPGARTIDDSFITFRYARNLLAGHGFVYNPGEAVLGTTTPLYTLLMAGLGSLSGGTQAPFPELALVVNALADAATCLLLWAIGRRLKMERAGAAAALAWAVAPFSVTFAIGGLETSLYVALLTGAVATALAASPSKRVLAALLASLALLTRPDALILLGPLMLERLWSACKRSERIHWAEVAAALLPYGAWAIYATLVFGSPLPHSILAKAAAYALGPGEAMIRLVQHYATPFMEQNLLGAPLAVGVGLLLYPFLFLVGGWRAWKVEPRVLPWLLYPWLYLATFAIPNPLIFRWYLTPPLPAYFFFIFAGLEALLGRVFTAVSPPPKKENGREVPTRGGRVSIKRLLYLFLLLPVLVSLADWRLSPDHGPSSPAPAMAYIKLELLYRQAAERIAAGLTSESLLAAGDVGVLGYYTPARILDTVGLNSPISTGYYPLPAGDYVINYAIPAALILDQLPDWIVILEVYGRNTLLPDPAFQATYRLVETIDTDMYGSEGMLIFQRR